MRKLYDHPWTQTIIAGLILFNFICNIVESELLHITRKPSSENSETTSQHRAQRSGEIPREEGREGENGELQLVFDRMDMAFTLIYLIELIINLYAHWWRAFISSPWNFFDLFIVLFSIFEVLYVDYGLGSTTPEGQSGLDVNMLRLVRIFRVVRIFNKLRSMRRIIDAMIYSLTPVLSAFLLSFLLVSIYAIVACNIFVEKYSHAKIYFGSFSLAFISLLGVATGDSWTEEVRAMSNDSGQIDVAVGLFFISYILGIGIIMVNVIVSVLIEGFMSSMRDDEEIARVAIEVANHHKIAGFLDPVLSTLANFTSAPHLNHELELIFALWYTRAS